MKLSAPSINERTIEIVPATIPEGDVLIACSTLFKTCAVRIFGGCQRSPCLIDGSLSRLEDAPKEGHLNKVNSPAVSV
jgi:hypothetical protein